MAAAYRYADSDGPKPGALQLLEMIDRFGAEAVTGKRVIGVKDLRRMTLAEYVVRSYQERQHTENWAEWAKSSPRKAAILNQAARAAGEVTDG